MHLVTEPKTHEAKTDRKGEIDNSTVTAGDSNTLLSTTDKTTRQKMNQKK